MASSIVLSDNGVTSGSAGIKSTGGNDGVLLLQTTTAGGVATTAVTVDNTQQIGIGTSSPADIVHISSASPRLTFTSTNNTSGARYNTVGTATTGSHRFQYGGTEVLTIGIAGQTTALQGGTVSSGTGIAFPATQSASSDANTLDDYEEGTFSPTMSSGSGGPIVLSYGLGQYTKIGNVVNVRVRVTVSNANSAGGLIQIAGLPFTVSSSVTQRNRMVSADISNVTGSTTDSVGNTYAGNGGTTISILTSTAGNITLTNSSSMDFNGTYFTT
jgi:hypothetical protein